ncbi:uncharacterized protein H6S33_004497 [Morchella sextelata]|uniref:uncharacterized protein n=1 Tax=Morchella sextelata TaxID=1174677 RepID=UPI001D03D116|nr:uncharacterized protein H6S33_004497 [Morchella sextelata]KAH0606040.1 hypothetical protein H6S33_004497 [Morchella sextelata]
MATTTTLVGQSAPVPVDKGKCIEVIDITTITHQPDQENHATSITYSDTYLDLENIPGLDLTLLSTEDLSSEKWWKQYPPPPELIWSVDDSSHLKDMIFKEWAEALESVLETIKNEQDQKEETPVTIEAGESSRSNPADAPELVSDTITPVNEAPLPQRNSLRVSVGSVHGTVSELESPVSPRSITDLRSIADSMSSTGSKKSKSRRELPKYNISGSASLIYSPYFSPLPANDSTVVSMPVSPRVEQVKRFWKKSLGTGESECSSCLDDHKNKKLVKLACQHRYCFVCLETLIRTSMQDESLWPPRCCIQDIPQKTIEKALNKQDRQTYKGKAKEYAIPAADRVYCPHPTCSAWIPPSGTGRIICGTCNNSVCGTCRGIAHPAQADCPEDFDLQLTLEEGERQGWIRCYQCRTMVERTQGCNHITCKCGAHFCYICGSVWKTCACTGEEAARRRVARIEQVALNRAARAREEAEHQRSIEAIARMEQREQEIQERRAEADRIAAAQAARTEAKKRRELQERWLERVSAEFESAEKALLVLHQKQWGIMRDRHQKEKEEQEIEFSNRESESEKRFFEDMETLGKSQKREEEELNACFAQEREALTTKQATEEDEYWFELQTFLKGRPNKEARQKSLIEKFNETQAEQLNAFYQTQEQIAAKLATSHKEQTTNFINSVEKGREIEKQMSMTELKESTKHQWADIKWFVVVQMARNTRLVDMWEASKGDEEAKQRIMQVHKPKATS